MTYFIIIGKFKLIWLIYFWHWTAFLQCFISKDGIVVIYERISYIHVYGFFQKCFGQEMWRSFQYIANYAPIFFYIYLEGLPNSPENTSNIFLEIWDVFRCIFTIKEDKQTFWRVVKSYICCGGNVWYWFSTLTNRANFKKEPVFISGRYICETFI